MVDIAHNPSAEETSDIDRVYVSEVPTQALMAELRFRSDHSTNGFVLQDGVINIYRKDMEMRLYHMQSELGRNRKELAVTGAMMAFPALGVFEPLSVRIDPVADLLPFFYLVEDYLVSISGLIAVVAVGIISPILVDRYRALREKQSKITAQQNLIRAIIELEDTSRRRKTIRN